MADKKPVKTTTKPSKPTVTQQLAEAKSLLERALQFAADEELDCKEGRDWQNRAMLVMGGDRKVSVVCELSVGVLDASITMQSAPIPMNEAAAFKNHIENDDWKAFIRVGGKEYACTLDYDDLIVRFEDEFRLKG